MHHSTNAVIKPGDACHMMVTRLLMYLLKGRYIKGLFLRQKKHLSVVCSRVLW